MNSVAFFILGAICGFGGACVFGIFLETREPKEHRISLDVKRQRDPADWWKEDEDE